MKCDGINHLAFKVPRSHPKYSDERTTTSAIGSFITEFVSEELLQAGEALPTVDVNRESGETPNTGPLVRAIAASASTSFACHRMSELRLRAVKNHLEKSLENVRVIAQLLDRRIQLEGEKSALLAYVKYKCKIAEDLADRSEYLARIRKNHLNSLRQHLLGAAIEPL